MRTSAVKTNGRDHWFAYALIVALPLLGAVFVVTASPNFVAASKAAVRESPIGSDFLQEWIGGRIVASGQADHLYDDRWTRALQHDSSLLGFRWDEGQYYPMVYPPFYYALVSPLSRLPLRSAATIWCIGNALAFSLGLLLLTMHLRPRLRHWIWVLPIAGLFHPFLTSLNMGQKSGWLLLILSATLVLLQRGRQFSAGAVFGLVVFKPHLGVIIGLTMLLKRQYRFVAGAAMPVLFAAFVSLGMGGAACLGFWQVCTGAAKYADNAGYALVDAQNVLGSVKMILHSGPPWFSGAISLFSFCAILIGLWNCFRGPFDARRDRFLIQYSALIVGTILLSPHFFNYDLTIVLIPMLLMGTRLIEPCSGKGQLSLAHGWLTAVIFVGAGFFSAIANATGLPVSVGLLCAWLFFLCRELAPRQPTIAPQDAAEIPSNDLELINA